MYQKEIQKEIELKWHNILSNDPTEENYEKAYQELHSFYLESTNGMIYSHKLSFISRSFLNFIGSNNEILEIGCGNGLFSKKVAEKNNNVVGIDISKIAISIANKNKNSKLNLKYLHGDARKLNFEDNRFDIVISIDVIEHISPQGIVNHFRDVNRVLKPGGYYLFWTPHKYYGATSLGMHLKEYTLREMSDILYKCDFQPFIFAYLLNMKVRDYMITYEKILYRSHIYRLGKYIRLIKLFVPPLCIYARKN